MMMQYYFILFFQLPGIHYVYLSLKRGVERANGEVR